MSISRSRTTSGVIQPAQSFRRGNVSLSSTRTLAPPRRRRRAAVEPAGPPPTIKTSTLCTSGFRRSAIEVLARPGHVVVLFRSEHDLEELQRAGGEAGDRSGEIEAPHALELLVEHLAHL